MPHRTGQPIETANLFWFKFHLYFRGEQVCIETQNPLGECLVSAAPNELAGLLLESELVSRHPQCDQPSQQRLDLSQRHRIGPV